MVLRHLTLLSRPSSIDGVVWEDKHEPKILFDFSVFLSCLMFMLIIGALYFTDDPVGAGIFSITTLFSTLSDSIYFNHYWLDTADRIFAVVGAAYLLYACFLSWFFKLSQENIFSTSTFVKTLMVFAFAVPPVWFLNNSRKNPVRSEPWRWFHIRWHIFGALGGAVSVLIGAGWFDDHLENNFTCLI